MVYLTTCCFLVLFRDVFNELCGDLIERVKIPLQDALAKSGNCATDSHAPIFPFPCSRFPILPCSHSQV